MADFYINKSNFLSASYDTNISFKDTMPSQRGRHNSLSKSRCGFKRIYTIKSGCLSDEDLSTVLGIFADDIDYVDFRDNDLFSVRGLSPSLLPATESYSTGFFGNYATLTSIFPFGSAIEYSSKGAKAISAMTLSGLPEERLGWDFIYADINGRSMVNGEDQANALSVMELSGLFDSTVSIKTGDYCLVTIYNFIPSDSYLSSVLSNVRGSGEHPVPSRYPTIQFPGLQETFCVATQAQGKTTASPKGDRFSLVLKLEEISINE